MKNFCKLLVIYHILMAFFLLTGCSSNINSTSLVDPASVNVNTEPSKADTENTSTKESETENTSTEIEDIGGGLFSNENKNNNIVADYPTISYPTPYSSQSSANSSSYDYSSFFSSSYESYSFPKDNKDLYREESSLLYKKYTDDVDKVHRQYQNDTDNYVNRRFQLESDISSLQNESFRAISSLESQISSTQKQKQAALSNALAQSNGYETSYYRTLEKDYDDRIKNLEIQKTEKTRYYDNKIIPLQKELDNLKSLISACEPTRDAALKALKEKYDADLQALKKKYNQ